MIGRRELRGRLHPPRLGVPRLRGVPWLANENGASYALLIVMLPMLLGFVGLVIEGGMILEVRRQLQTSVDAGALAGAHELPDWPIDAEAIARDYTMNRNRESEATASTGVSTTFVTDDTITVSAVRNLSLVLLPLVGYPNAQDVAATATAIKGSLIEAKCVLPIGIVDLTPDDGLEDGFGYEFGEWVELKPFPGAGGNFHLIDLTIGPGGGASETRELIEGNCLDESVGVGDSRYTQPGAESSIRMGFENRIGDDDHEFNDLFEEDGTWKAGGHVDCPRIILIPVVNTFDVSGNTLVEIEGFVHFFVADPLPGPGHESEVVGYFVKKVPRSGVGGAYTPYGIDVVRLIR